MCSNGIAFGPSPAEAEHHAKAVHISISSFSCWWLVNGGRRQGRVGMLSYMRLP